MKNIETLDEESLERLISILRSAQKAGFNSLSSPIEVLWDTLIDFVLVLSTKMEEGSLSLRQNPALKELPVRDELGNPKMIKITPQRRFIWDPEIGRFFKNNLLPFFVLLKKRRFHRCFRGVGRTSSKEGLRSEEW